MKKSTLIISIIIILAVIGGIFYWFFIYNKTNTVVDDPSSTTGNKFNPINRGGNGRVATSTNNNGNRNATSTTINNNGGGIVKLPKLRLISANPVAGMFASSTKIKPSTTSSTTIDQTILRFIDRGTGHIYQANDLNLNIEKISNTTLPKIYEAYWNKNLTAFIARYLKSSDDSIINFYAEMRKTATSTASSTTPYEIKGKYLSPNITEIAISPAADKIFTWNIENGKGIGYISAFDEKSKVKIIETPLNQVNIDWPETSTVLITTKGSGVANGYAYSANTKTGDSTKIIGNIVGLSAKMSSDGKKLIYSSGGTSISTKILDIKTSTSTEVIFSTLVDKCVWSKLNINELFCAVPTDLPNGIYPDDWYRGAISFNDKIWSLDITTGEVHLMANLLTLSNRSIDATQLTLDPKENYLYFINKDDLSLWSLDLNQ